MRAILAPPCGERAPRVRPSDLECPLTPKPYVKVQLMLLQRKWKKRKMSSRKGTVAPYFNEAFTFHVPLSQIQVGCLEEEVGRVSPGPS